MTKWIVGGVVVVILGAIVAAGVYLTQNLDAIVKDLIEQVGTESTGTAVKVGEVQINLGEGTASISNLTVANPPGYSRENLFSLDNIRVAIDTGSLTKDVYVINAIDVTGVRVLAEQKGSKTNVQALLDGMPAAEEPAGDQQTGSDVLMAVRQVNVEDGNMLLRSEQLGERELTLRAINLRDLGSAENGLTPDQVGQAIAAQLVAQVRDSVTRAIQDYLKEEAKEKLKEKLGDRLGDLFN